jgi:hypothetical protein
MKTIIWSSVLAALTAILAGCATGSSSQASTSTKISGYLDTSVEHHSK